MLKKRAQGPHYWPQVVERVKSIGLRPEIIAMLNSANQIVWDHSPPADNPNAIAYVSSEDKNNDGKIDKIHFVLSKFPPNASEDEVESIIEMVAKTLVHEYGHIEDFDTETGFPGGEAAAEAAERQSESTIQSGLNSSSSLLTFNNIKGRNLNMLKELQKLANHLDEIGEIKLADKLDSIIASNIKLGQRHTQHVPPDKDIPDKDINARVKAPALHLHRNSTETEITQSLREYARKTVLAAVIEFLPLPDHTPVGPDPEPTSQEERDALYDSYFEDGQGGTSMMDATGGLAGVTKNSTILAEYSTLMSLPLGQYLISEIEAAVKRKTEEAAVKRKTDSRRRSLDLEAARPEPTAQPEASQAKAVKTSDALKKIQTLIGSEPDGQWGPNTRDKLKFFLMDFKDMLDPKGITGVNQVMSWGTGYKTVSVGGVSAPGSYAKGWSGLLRLLTDLKGKAMSAPAASYESGFTATTSEAMDDVVSSLSSAFSSGMPKFSR
jgi:hypothetical protein